MRPSLSSISLRDVSRVCVRCRLEARRASSLARPNASGWRITTSQDLPKRQSLPAPTQGATFSSKSRFHAASTAFENPASTASSTTSPSTEQRQHQQQQQQRPHTLYDIFPETLPSGPPPSGHFPINLRALRREFLQLQARAHPDMHPSGTLKTRAEARSALINEAYKTLSNPLLRAQYLLSLRGVDVANDETLKIEDPELLMVVLEAHEEISDAGKEEDLAGLREVNDGRISRSEEVLEKAFREDDVRAAKVEAVRMRYWVNIKQSLDDWEEGKPPVLQH